MGRKDRANESPRPNYFPCHDIRWTESYLGEMQSGQLGAAFLGPARYGLALLRKSGLLCLLGPTEKSERRMFISGSSIQPRREFRFKGNEHFKEMGTLGKQIGTQSKLPATLKRVDSEGSSMQLSPSISHLDTLRIKLVLWELSRSRTKQTREQSKLKVKPGRGKRQSPLDTFVLVFLSSNKNQRR